MDRTNGQLDGLEAADAFQLTPDLLLARVGAGDLDAFDRLHELIAGRVLGLARHVVRNEAHAEEVCQEVLTDVWRYADRFDPARGSALGWIMTMTHHRAVERVRCQQASAERDHKAAIRDYRVPFDEVSEEVEGRLDYERVHHCLTALTPLQRQSVLLAYYEDRTSREIGELLGTPVGTIKSRLHDALIRLRDCLEMA